MRQAAIQVATQIVSPATKGRHSSARGDGSASPHRVPFTSCSGAPPDDSFTSPAGQTPGRSVQRTFCQGARADYPYDAQQATSVDGQAGDLQAGHYETGDRQGDDN